MNPMLSMFIAGFIAGALFMFYAACYVIGKRRS